MKELFVNVRSNIEIVKGIHKLKLYNPTLPEFIPGQFINLATGNFDGTVLRRPLSVYKYDAKEKTFEVIFDVKGNGTTFLSRLKGGDLPATLFLGNGFNIDDKIKRVALIGGGMGCPPLYSVIERYKNKGIRFYTYIGFTDKGKAICIEDFEAVSDRLTITSDDGSIGEKGLVTDAFKAEYEKIKPELVLACGPRGMLKALKDLKLEVPVYVSMEERMGCGIGACYTCICATIEGNRRVCADGPVFEIKEVIL